MVSTIADPLHLELLRVVEFNLTALSNSGVLLGRCVAYLKDESHLCIFQRGAGNQTSCSFDLSMSFMLEAASHKSMRSGAYPQQFIAHHWALIARKIARWDADARQEAWMPPEPESAAVAFSPDSPAARLCPSHQQAYLDAMGKAIGPRHSVDFFLAQVNIDARARAMRMALDMEERGLLTYAEISFGWKSPRQRRRRPFCVASSSFHSSQGVMSGLSWLDSAANKPNKLCFDAEPIAASAFGRLVCLARIALSGREAFIERAAAKVIQQICAMDESFREKNGISAPAGLLALREAEALDKEILPVLKSAKRRQAL